MIEVTQLISSTKPGASVNMADQFMLIPTFELELTYQKSITCLERNINY